MSNNRNPFNFTLNDKMLEKKDESVVINLELEFDLDLSKTTIQKLLDLLEDEKNKYIATKCDLQAKAKEISDKRAELIKTKVDAENKLHTLNIENTNNTNKDKQKELTQKILDAGTEYNNALAAVKIYENNSHDEWKKALDKSKEAEDKIKQLHSLQKDLTEIANNRPFTPQKIKEMEKNNEIIILEEDDENKFLNPNNAANNNLPECLKYYGATLNNHLKRIMEAFNADNKINENTSLDSLDKWINKINEDAQQAKNLKAVVDFVKSKIAAIKSGWGYIEENRLNQKIDTVDEQVKKIENLERTPNDVASHFLLLLYKAASKKSSKSFDSYMRLYELFSSLCGEGKQSDLNPSLKIVLLMQAVMDEYLKLVQRGVDDEFTKDLAKFFEKFANKPNKLAIRIGNEKYHQNTLNILKDKKERRYRFSEGNVDMVSIIELSKDSRESILFKALIGANLIKVEKNVVVYNTNHSNNGQQKAAQGLDSTQYKKLAVCNHFIEIFEQYKKQVLSEDKWRLGFYMSYSRQDKAAYAQKIIDHLKRYKSAMEEGKDNKYYAKYELPLDESGTQALKELSYLKDGRLNEHLQKLYKTGVNLGFSEVFETIQENDQPQKGPNNRWWGSK